MTTATYYVFYSTDYADSIVWAQMQNKTLMNKF